MSSAEWAGLQAGLRQRAELLNAMLADFYGPRTLLHSGVVPSELVLGHRGVLPAGDGLSLTGDHQLTIGGTGQLARQLIQPKIVGDSVGMPPLPTLFLLYIGYKLGGVVGMIVAVPVGLIALTMYQEGALQTTKDSVKILTAGINHFRRLKPEDMDEVRQMQERDRRLSEELARQAAEEEAQKEAQKEARKEAQKEASAKKQKEKKS